MTPVFERLTFREKCPTPMMQMHYARYLWALRFCTDLFVLDAGCGSGYGTELLARVASRIDGVDISPEAISEAHENRSCNAYCAYHNEPIETFTNSYGYDVIVAFEMLEHVVNMTTVLDVFSSLLNPGGRLLVSVPLHQGQNIYHHGRDFGYSKWRRLIQAHFLIVSSWHQPLETQDGSNVCIMRIAERSSFNPQTGVAIFECA